MEASLSRACYSEIALICALSIWACQPDLCVLFSALVLMIALPLKFNSLFLFGETFPFGGPSNALMNWNSVFIFILQFIFSRTYS